MSKQFTRNMRRARNDGDFKEYRRAQNRLKLRRQQVSKCLVQGVVMRRQEPEMGVGCECVTLVLGLHMAHFWWQEGGVYDDVKVKTSLSLMYDSNPYLLQRIF
jgi:hypothetical protein